MYRRFYPAALVLLFIGLAGGTIVDDVLDALQKAVDCASCHALLHPLQALAHLGNDPFVDLLSQVCIQSGVCFRPCIFGHLPNAVSMTRKKTPMSAQE